MKSQKPGVKNSQGAKAGLFHKGQPKWWELFILSSLLRESAHIVCPGPKGSPTCCSLVRGAACLLLSTRLLQETLAALWRRSTPQTQGGKHDSLVIWKGPRA